MNIPWERLSPSLPAENFASVYEQPSQLLDYLRPQLSPLISPLSTDHMQFDPELFSNISYQQPVQPDVNFQF
jgi:hypothetical protein